MRTSAVQLLPRLLRDGILTAARALQIKSLAPVSIGGANSSVEQSPKGARSFGVPPTPGFPRPIWKLAGIETLECMLAAIGSAMMENAGRSCAPVGGAKNGVLTVQHILHPKARLLWDGVVMRCAPLRSLIRLSECAEGSSGSPSQTGPADCIA